MVGIIIKFKNQAEEEEIISFFDNLKGKNSSLIWAGYAIFKAIETDIIKKENLFFLKLKERIEHITNVNVEEGIYNFFTNTDEVEIDAGYYLLLDITDKAIKYSFVDLWEDKFFSILNANEFLDLCRIKEKNLKSSSWNKWAEYIVDRGYLMRKAEAENLLKEQNEKN